ncbi:MAG TPA: site-specific integrase [Ktedonobacteraceae bacterium]|nr:site-specific integrase [Ktedonobacteraceae bacterium]
MEEDPCPNALIQAPFSESDSLQHERQARPVEPHEGLPLAPPACGSDVRSEHLPEALSLLASSESEGEDADVAGQATQTLSTALTQPGEADMPARLVQTIEGGILRYLEDLKASGRLPKTLEWHQSALRNFKQYLAQHRHHRLLSQLSRDDVRGWATFLGTSQTAAGRLRSTSTIATYLRSVRAFCNFAQRQGVNAHELLAHATFW